MKAEGSARGLVVALANDALHSSLEGIKEPDPPTKLRLKFDGEFLHLETTDGVILNSFRANSGRGPHMNNPESTDVVDYGPIPEGEYFLYLEPGVPAQKSGGPWGDWGIIINPYLGTRISNKLFENKRFGFFIHEDGNINESGGLGSAGCIAICSKKDTHNLWGSLRFYRALGFSRIDLSVNY